jgi:hypothetical protein
MTSTLSGARKRSGILSRIRRSSPDHADNTSQPCSQSEPQPATTTSQVQSIPIRGKPDISNDDNTSQSKLPGYGRGDYRKRLVELVGRRKDRCKEDKNAEGAKKEKVSHKEKPLSIAKTPPDLSRLQFGGVKSETVDDRPKIGSMPAEYLVQLTAHQRTRTTIAQNEAGVRTLQSKSNCKPIFYQYQPSGRERRPAHSPKTQASGFRSTTSNAKSLPYYSRSTPSTPVYDATRYWEHTGPEKSRPHEMFSPSLPTPSPIEFSRAHDLNFSCLRCREAKQSCFAGPSNGTVAGQEGHLFRLPEPRIGYSSFKVELRQVSGSDTD